MKPLILAIALLGAPLTTSLAAQDSWVADVSYPYSHDLNCAVSEGGRIALVQNNEPFGASINVYTAGMSPIHDFRIDPVGGNVIDINAAIFLNETTLVIAGSVASLPYMGAFHVGTGVAIWEESLTKSGAFSELAINSIGKVVGCGRITSSGQRLGLLCAVNPTGGWAFYRTYNPSTTNLNIAENIVPLPNGDMFLMSTSTSGLAISRLTDWGHEVWSKWYAPTDLVINRTLGCISSDGDLMVAGRYYETAQIYDNVLMRIDSDDGAVRWAKRYQLPGSDSAATPTQSLLPTEDGGVIMGCDSHPDSIFAPALVKVSTDGLVDWAKEVSAGASTGILKIDDTSDGGFIAISKLSGSTARIVRTDVRGNAGLCAGAPITVPHEPTVVQDTAFTYHYDPYPGVCANHTTTTSSTTSQVTMVCHSSDTVGTTFCDPANPNSTGFATRLTGRYSGFIGFGLHLDARHGPQNQFGYFLIGSGVSEPGIVLGQGRFCLSTIGGNQFGRYNVSGGSLNSLGRFDSAGVLQNLAGTSAEGSGFDVPFALPGISGNMTSGQTWHFQLWHREAGGQSNLSNGISVDF
ncbi:MAG: hypothetical protein P1V35_16800 [Planctomycetota bacterium]|nr:hypothetical protein [Planctomycetota bacterium]